MKILHVGKNMPCVKDSKITSRHSTTIYSYQSNGTFETATITFPKIGNWGKFLHANVYQEKCVI